MDVDWPETFQKCVGIVCVVISDAGVGCPWVIYGPAMGWSGMVVVSDWAWLGVGSIPFLRTSVTEAIQAGGGHSWMP